jgi:hypothetical protein
MAKMTTSQAEILQQAMAKYAPLLKRANDHELMNAQPEADDNDDDYPEETETDEDNVQSDEETQQDAHDGAEGEESAAEGDASVEDDAEGEAPEEEAVEGEAVADDDAVEGEAVADDDAVEGEAPADDDAVEGEAPADDDAVEGEAVEEEAVEGEAAEEDAVESEAAEEDAVEGEAAEEDAVEGEAPAEGEAEDDTVMEDEAEPSETLSAEEMCLLDDDQLKEAIEALDLQDGRPPYSQAALTFPGEPNLEDALVSKELHHGKKAIHVPSYKLVLVPAIKPSSLKNGEVIRITRLNEYSGVNGAYKVFMRGMKFTEKIDYSDEQQGIVDVMTALRPEHLVGNILWPVDEDGKVVYDSLSLSFVRTETGIWLSRKNLDKFVFERFIPLECGEVTNVRKHAAIQALRHLIMSHRNLRKAPGMQAPLPLTTDLLMAAYFNTGHQQSRNLVNKIVSRILYPEPSKGTAKALLTPVKRKDRPESERPSKKAKKPSVEEAEETEAVKGEETEETGVAEDDTTTQKLNPVTSMNGDAAEDNGSNESAVEEPTTEVQAAEPEAVPETQIPSVKAARARITAPKVAKTVPLASPSIRARGPSKAAKQESSGTGPAVGVLPDAARVEAVVEAILGAMRKKLDPAGDDRSVTIDRDHKKAMLAVQSTFDSNRPQFENGVGRMADWMSSFFMANPSQARALVTLVCKDTPTESLLTVLPPRDAMMMALGYWAAKGSPFSSLVSFVRQLRLHDSS